MNNSPKVAVDKIITEYNIDVDSTTSVKVENLKDSTNVFRVNRPDLIEELYIIDTIQGKNIACHPHIVGKTLKIHALATALETAKAINQLTALSTVDRDSTVFAHILRGGPGYELHTAFRKLNVKRWGRDIWIRPKYEKISYRCHDDESTEELNIVYENFENLPQRREIVLLKPDTEASGKTGQKSIERIVRECEKVESTIKEIILYGFISIPALEMISKTVKRYGINLVAFSIGNITELAHNSYDMTVYGIDESLWSASGKSRKLGSIINPITLERFLPEFIPGLDQPGDWSNRQTAVYVTKEKKEHIRIDQHLQSSINLIEKLKKISNYTKWQEKIAENELQHLYSTLKQFNSSI